MADPTGSVPPDRRQLHVAFEKRHPQAHQAFLKWLGLPAEAVRHIREHGRG
jgi:phytoene dehydrogenase-like protein